MIKHIELLLISEHFREVEEFRDELTVVLFVFLDTLPLVNETVEYSIRVVQPPVDLDEVVSEWLHPDEIAQ